MHVNLTDLIFEWAKVFPEDRDMGDPKGNNAAKKEAQHKGKYSVNCYFKTEDAKQAFVDTGIDLSPMGNDRIKKGNSEYGIGEYFKAMVYHEDIRNWDGEDVELGGPPQVVNATGGELRYWDRDTDGLIGNGSEGAVQVQMYKAQGKLTGMRLKKIRIDHHEVYEGESVDNSLFEVV